jgi:hypothetical protein
MPSTLAWLDHDAEARDRMERVLALFEERDTVDELGLGPVRDAFSDRLFPGTSTIQTRLRYFLFIPWIYRRMERERVPSRRVAERGRELEHRLTERLLGAEDTDGVFGKEAGRRLKRLASEVYWGGLGEWGIRRFEGSRKRYHAALDALYRRRDRLADREEEARPASRSAARTWHAGLPEPPEGFPETDRLGLALTREESEYLQDRVQEAHPSSLLATLFLEAEPVACDFPWQHPIWSELGERHREVLDHARVFSKVAQGATLLYNLLLARKDDRHEKIEEYEASFAEWEASLDRAQLEGWSLDRLWALTEDQGHTITWRARRFVRRWVERCRDARGLASDAEAAALVREREERLKGARSRFRNPSALDSWGGASGLGRFNYRWPIVSTYLDDLHTGLAPA